MPRKVMASAADSADAARPVLVRPAASSSVGDAPSAGDVEEPIAPNLNVHPDGPLAAEDKRARRGRIQACKRAVLRNDPIQQVGHKLQAKLKKNAKGRVVYTAVSQQKTQQYPTSKLAVWNKCVKNAREMLGLTGFVAMNRGPQG